MANLQLPRVSPTEGCSIAHKVMADAADYYLAHGGAAVARLELAKTNEGLKFYPDHNDAYEMALEKVARAEELARQAERQLLLEQQKELFQKIGDSLGGLSVRMPVRKPSTPPGTLPPKLATEQAMLLWHRLQQAGLVDDNYQPVGQSRADTAVLAYEMARRLHIRDVWVTFERFWNKKGLRSAYNRAQDQSKTYDLLDRLKPLLG